MIYENITVIAVAVLFFLVIVTIVCFKFKEDTDSFKSDECHTLRLEWLGSEIRLAKQSRDNLKSMYNLLPDDTREKEKDTFDITLGKLDKSIADAESQQLQLATLLLARVSKS
jgi:uncharacterized protein YoxC